MKSVRIRILSAALSLCLVLPALGCGTERDEAEEETTPYYASVVTRDEPEEGTPPEDTSADTGTDTEGDSAPAESTESETGEDGLSAIDRLRPDYNLGTCKSLRGEVAVVLFYVDDDESKWTREERERFTQNEVKPALAFLEQQAARYGVELKLTVKHSYYSVNYDGEVIQSFKETGYATSDVLWQMARQKIFSSTEDMLKAFRNRYITEEVICLTVFNKDGTSYGINPQRGAGVDLDEHGILFVRDLHTDTNGPDGSQASIVARVLLYLFGAEGYSTSESRKSIATYHYPTDLMLFSSYDIRKNTIGEATAFYIGWTDTVPSVFDLEGW
jgi:hypothetical protein